MTFAIDLVAAESLGVAGASGLVVGAEREWSGHAAGRQARFAGVRTFLLIGLLGGVAGWLTTLGHTLLAALILAAGAAMTIAAYWQAVRRRGSSLDGTTEAAALMVLALGVLAGLGHLLLSIAGTAVVTLALGEKQAIHRLVHRIGEQEMRAALQFGVLALVVLPLLPVGPFGPFGGVRPRLLWTVVLIFSGLNFFGYLARKGIGAERGIVVAGMVGGLFSSTGVTLSYARTSRDEPAMGHALAVGVAAACTVLFVRVTIACLLIDPRTMLALAPYLIAPALAAALTVGPWLRPVSGRPRPARPDSLTNPLGLRSAVQMAIALQVVLTAFQLVRQLGGPTAILPSAAILGLTDVDALTLAMTQFAASGGDAALAGKAIGVGIVANTVLKMALGLVVGRGSFRLAVLWRLGLQALLLIAGLVILGSVAP
jgi:uncharacterized membrane protein (DUF4010 family)